MVKANKLLERMRHNPAGDWSIDDVGRVCNRILGVELLPPAHGTHFKVTHPCVADILTIPARRPLKAVYVKRFVSMMDSIIAEADVKG
jgi:hypothetical protein